MLGTALSLSHDLRRQPSSNFLNHSELWRNRFLSSFSRQRQFDEQSKLLHGDKTSSVHRRRSDVFAVEGSLPLLISFGRRPETIAERCGKFATSPLLISLGHQQETIAGEVQRVLDVEKFKTPEGSQIMREPRPAMFETRFLSGSVANVWLHKFHVRSGTSAGISWLWTCLTRVIGGKCSICTKQWKIGDDQCICSYQSTTETDVERSVWKNFWDAHSWSATGTHESELVECHGRVTGLLAQQQFF